MGIWPLVGYGSRLRIKVSSLSEHESHELNEYCLQND